MIQIFYLLKTIITTKNLKSLGLIYAKKKLYIYIYIYIYRPIYGFSKVVIPIIKT